MPEDTVFNRIDKGTLRPNAKPLQTKGDAFYPMNLPDFGWEITLPEDVSADDPITLFTMYYPPKIINLIVEKTNQYPREPRDESRPYARANQWYPTCKGEIHVYFAICIYMTIYECNEISDYWDTSKLAPKHPTTLEMSRNRFQELHMRVRLVGKEAIGPFAKVEPLSSHIQQVNLSVWRPVKNIAVDEIIVRYERRAKETTTVPTKPTPTGYKVWGVAERGFLICWNWHVLGDKNGPVGIKTPVALGGTKRAGNGGNKTQAVALHLINRLPKPPPGCSYHVFLDNLFVFTKMVEYARSIGIAELVHVGTQGE